MTFDVDSRRDRATPTHRPYAPTHTLQRKAEEASRTPGAALLSTPAFLGRAPALQRRAATPALQASAFLQVDARALQRAMNELADQRAKGTQAAHAPPRLNLDGMPEHNREALLRSTHDSLYAAAVRDATYLPAAARAQHVTGMIQRKAEQGFPQDLLRMTLLQRVQDEQLRTSLQREFAVQDARNAEQEQARQQEAALQRQRALQQQEEAHAALTQQTALQRIEARRGRGDPLPPAVRAHLEAGLNADLSRVRVHADSEAALIAKSVHAEAFTSGHDIYFAANKYDPTTAPGIGLIAHEAAHVVQQASGRVSPGVDPDASLEADAQQKGESLAQVPDRASQAVTPSAPRAPRAPRATQSAALQRKAAPTTARPTGDAAAALHDLVEKLTKRESTTGSPATLLLGVEAAADLRLGSTRTLVKDGGFLSGPGYASLDGAVEQLMTFLKQLKANGTLQQAITTYGQRYGKTFTAVLGERVRNVNARQKLLALLPPVIGEAQLTMDAFLEQIAVGWVYMNESADDLTNLPLEERRQSSPKAVLAAYGYRAGPPISGRWGFQMRVFYPIPGKAKWPHPIVAFRGTEGIKFDPTGEKSAKEKPKPGADPARWAKDAPKRQAAGREGTVDTIVGDFAPAGVGYNQYRINYDLIKMNMDAAAKRGKLMITGHSLGGALAQIAAVEYRAVTAQLVTFQAAAISEADVQKVLKYNKDAKTPLLARHYRVDGDVVPAAGEANLPGQIYYFDRAERPKGSTKPFGIDLSFDAADASRATSGHVIPMLSTFVRGMNAQTGLLGLIAKSGLKDETTLPKDPEEAKDVTVVFGGQYDVKNDPRIELEQKRTTLGVKAMKGSNQYETVFYDQIAYNTLLSTVERLAREQKTFNAFLAAADGLIGRVQGKGRLPLTPEDRALGQQLKLKATQKDTQRPITVRGGYGFATVTYPEIPSEFAKMQTEGVLITRDAAVRVAAQLRQIWRAWHPEETK